MPAKSQQQMKYIYAMRSKYVNKKKAPKNMKWVFDSDWTSGVKMKKLPKKMNMKNESRIMSFGTFVNENYEYENFTMSDMEYVKDLYDEGMTDVNDIARECEGVFNNNCTGDECVAMVNQILNSLRKNGSIDKKEKNICSSCDDFDCENCEDSPKSRCNCECCK